MAPRLSGEQRRKLTESLEREEEAKIAQRKEMDNRELRHLKKEARMLREPKVRDAVVVKNTKVKQILVRERDHLEDGLRSLKSYRRCMMDNKQAQEISNLFAQGDDLDEAIAKEKQYIADLKSQIHKSTKSIHEVKKKKGDSAIFLSEYMHKKENERVGRALGSWESKLAAEQSQLALVTKENEELRIKMLRLLKEKGQFNKLFGELMGKLTKGKSIMADVVDRARQQFQRRDEIYRKIEALKSRDKVELGKRMEEMQEMELKLFEDKYLLAFRYKVQKMRENLAAGEKSDYKESVVQRELGARLQKANDYWEQLQDATGMQTCEEICKHIVAEDSNLFELYNFNNEIRDQLEVLTSKTADLVTTVNEESEAEEVLLQDCIKSKNIMVKTLMTMEQNFNDISDVLDSNTRLFSRLLDKIKSLFDLIKCSSSTLKDLLGNNMKVTEHNYRMYLNLIEAEVINMLESMSPMLSIGADPIHRSTKSVLSRVETHGTTTGGSAKRVIVTRYCLECEGGRRNKVDKVV